MKELLENLVAFSNKYGSDPELVLAGGGNTSAKKDGFMFVKGSGTKLATIKADEFVEIDLNKLNKIFEKTYPDSDAEREALVLEDLMNSRCPGNENKRPSVETTLHGIFEQTYVLHLHPALINGLTCAVDGKKITAELFGNDVIWIDACRPGYILAKICYDKMTEFKATYNRPADIIILQNHGIFIAADDVESLGNKLNNVISKLKEKLIALPDHSSVSFESKEAELKKCCGGYCEAIDSKDAVNFASGKAKAGILLKPFTPDHIVYCKAYPLFVDKGEDIAAMCESYSKKNGYLPRVIIVEGNTVYCCGDSEKTALTAALLFKDAMKIAVYSASFGGPLHMSDELTDFIVNWEVESYRSKQNG